MILVVDDDDDVRDLIVGLLASEGYPVRAARSGEEGLAVIKSDPSVVLLFTDIVMPGPIDGWRLAAEAKRLRPELRVLYTSGFNRDGPAERHVAGHGVLLPKPWRPHQLIAHIQDALA